jgi:O-antigen/teichoic acid export membrane protein
MSLGVIVQGAVTIAVLAVLARLLSPADFGIVSAGLLVINFCAIFSQGLVGPAVVQQPALGEKHVRSAFSISVLGGIGLLVALWILAPTVAHVLRANGLAPIVRALAWILPVQGLGAVAEALLRRDLRFRAVASIRMISYAVGYGVVGIGVAVLGGGLWSLVAANAAQVLVNTALLLFRQPHSKRLQLDARASRELLATSGGIILGSLGNYSARNGDNLVVVRWLGVAALGLYERAYALMTMPATLIGQVLDDVLFPAIAQIQVDRARVATVYRRCVGAVALVSLPLSAVVVILAPEIIAVILGPRWAEAAVPFRILAVGTLFRTSYKISESLSRALGAVYRNAWRQWTYATLVVSGSIAGQHWGLAGVSWAVVGAIFANYLLTAHLAIRLVSLGWSAYVLAHRAGVKAAVVVAGPAWLTATLVRNLPGASPLLVLGVTLAVALVAVALLGATRPERVLEEDGRWLVQQLIRFGMTKLRAVQPAAQRSR